MDNTQEVRIDKWLWAVRIFKTRSMATEACRKGKIVMDNKPVKPSRMVKKDDVVTVKKLPVFYKYLVKEVLSKRVSAKIVENYVTDLTPEDELKKRLVPKDGGFFIRDKGAGRPTKKERREMEKIYKKGSKS